MKDDLKLFEIRGDYQKQAENQAGWYQTVEKEAAKSMQSWRGEYYEGEMPEESGKKGGHHHNPLTKSLRYSL